VVRLREKQRNKRGRCIKILRTEKTWPWKYNTGNDRIIEKQRVWKGWVYI